ncbi:hypothetical protein RFI_12662 [Reticulomyxa filosa]|uniref:Pre-mRNA splicing factor component Cdc5p/Cef1 C-terminal domain-containing protein n=1 Tax=Reticulomyxa filosa TaxID=46433 RepID=X6NGL1_RETFI|nr:hypothetical protein RFI_12662 [Reticulomyxa filosa]|eukprot:ETO24492.1 hypothetical protein RFI_12662 [Reticulomyxa filosa]
MADQDNEQEQGSRHARRVGQGSERVVDGNTPGAKSAVSAATTTTMSEREKLKRRQKLRQRLREELSSLPSPTDACTIALPDTPPPPLHLQELHQHASSNRDGMLEDASDRDRRAHQDVERQKELEFQRQSQVIQKNLPRPSIVNGNMEHTFIEFHDKSPNYVNAGEMIRKEMLMMMECDNQMFDRENQDDKGRPALKARKKHESIARLPHYSDDQLQKAKDMLEEQLFKENELHQYDKHKHENDEILESMMEQSVFIPSLKRFGFVSNKTELSGEKLQVRQQEFHVLRKQLDKSITQCKQNEQKLDVLCKGYQNIAKFCCFFFLKKKINTAKNIRELHTKLLEADTQIRIYQELKEREAEVIPYRLKEWKYLLEKEKQRENELQHKFEDLRAQLDYFKETF